MFLYYILFVLVLRFRVCRLNFIEKVCFYITYCSCSKIPSVQVKFYGESMFLVSRQSWVPYLQTRFNFTIIDHSSGKGFMMYF